MYELRRTTLGMVCAVIEVDASTATMSALGRREKTSNMMLDRTTPGARDAQERRGD